MANIFKQNLDLTQNPNRNNHDLTHKVHGTYKFGKLYPFLCKPVVPSDSFRIDTACGFQFMPMPFPTQSNIRVVFHYFYVRNKNLWSNWENWLQGLEEHTPPFINQPVSFYKTGSLADFLDVPTTLCGSSSELVSLPISSFGDRVVAGGNQTIQLARLTANVLSLDGSDSPFTSSQNPFYIFAGNMKGRHFDTSFTDSLKLATFGIEFPERIGTFQFVLLGSDNDPANSKFIDPDYTNNYSIYSISSNGYSVEVDSTLKTITCYCTSNVINDLNRAIDSFDRNYISIGIRLIPTMSISTSLLDFQTSVLSLRILQSDNVVDLSEALSGNPFYNTFDNSGDDTIKISALPFRAYESIYRCYYANSVLQPLEINGEKKFNRYNTNLDDGADNTDYHLFNRNWELDAYTSCLPSPQQGNAPLVGMNVLGQVTIQDPDTGAITTADTQVDGEDVSLVVTSPIQSVEHGRTLVNLLNTGISIADLRQTNNLTRFLEQSIRSGYRYVDFIKGQFGNEPKYAELDMPEFLGGFSQRVDVNTISNTNGDLALDSDVKLGSYAGQARAFGGSEHGITRYFDDYGWIVGIMCIVPDAAYSQLLPKHFTFNSRLDYYFPLFSEIGLQPITYEEVAPIQSHHEYLLGDTNKKLTDTFGYQRPNHDLVWYPDTVHGQMRLSLKDTLINRIFERRPELGNDFLTIKPEETNNIFSVTEADNDVVIGQIVVKITAKRPVPRIVIPGLGR